MKIVVIGSSNIDMVAQVSHLPAPGETVGDACFMQLLGGKGANQAVAAALKVETATKALLISANQLNLTYTNGTLTAATLPKGSTVGITSTTSELNTNLTLGTDIDVLSNGQIALNSTTLGKISASLVNSLNKFNSEKGTATVTAVVAPSEGQIIAATSKSFATKYTVSVLSKSITGYGTSAKVTVE